MAISTSLFAYGDSNPENFTRLLTIIVFFISSSILHYQLRFSKSETLEKTCIKMKTTIYALLIGINDYDAPVRKLGGCINDVIAIQAYLHERFKEDTIDTVTLIDHQATRNAICHQIQTHLGQAGPEDIFFLYYSGHGMREKLCPEFAEFVAEGVGEAIVCHDFLQKGKWQIADKELTYLLTTVASKGAKGFVILDCCHSESGIRGELDAPKGTLIQARLEEPRPFDSYMPGTIETMQALLQGEYQGCEIAIFAACSRFQKAYETADRQRGRFTVALLAALQKMGSAISCQELIAATQRVMGEFTRHQQPSLDTLGYFDVQTEFLGHKRHNVHTNSLVFQERGEWGIYRGVFDDLPINSKQLSFSVTSTDTPQVEFKASLQFIGPDKSIFNFPKKYQIPGHSYRAKLLSASAQPIMLGYFGQSQRIDELREYMHNRINLVFESLEVCEYELLFEQDHVRLQHRQSQKTLSIVFYDNTLHELEYDWRQKLYTHLRWLYRWIRMGTLGNSNTKDNCELHQFSVALIIDGQEYVDESVLLSKSHQSVPFKVRILNNADITLYFTLVVIDPDFGIKVYQSERVTSRTTFEGWSMKVGLGEGDLESQDTFIIVATNYIPSLSMLQQPSYQLWSLPLRSHRAAPSNLLAWAKKEMRHYVKRELGSLGVNDILLPGGMVCVHGNPHITGTVTTASIRSAFVQVKAIENLKKFIHDLGNPIKLCVQGNNSAEVIELYNLETNEELVKSILTLTIRFVEKQSSKMTAIIWQDQVQPFIQHLNDSKGCIIHIPLSDLQPKNGTIRLALVAISDE